MGLVSCLALICIIGIAIVLISSIVDNNRFKTIEYKLSSDKVSKDCRIVFLSDLHGNRFGFKNEKLISAVRKINPDIIIMGGDMITATKDKVDSSNWENAYALIDGLKDYPVYYGIGNHEYRMNIYREDFKDAFDRYKKRLAELGVDVLYNDEKYLVDFNINIRGLVIDRKYYKRFEKNLMEDSYIESCFDDKEVIEGKSPYTIMMAHNPEYFEAYSKRAELTLSGHVHGGIVKLPFLGGVISPRLTLFPKYDGGLFEKENNHMVISRGLGSHTLPFRVFNPCELCVIDLNKI